MHEAGIYNLNFYFNRLVIFADHVSIKSPEKIELSGCVTGLGCIESAYMIQCVPCIKDYQDPEFPALLVYLQYLTQTEVMKAFCIFL